MSIIDKTAAFFKLKNKKQLHKRQKLQKIIEKLSAKAKGIKKRYRQVNDEEKKSRLLKEYKAVKKLLKKSRLRQAKLNEANIEK